MSRMRLLMLGCALPALMSAGALQPVPGARSGPAAEPVIQVEAAPVYPIEAITAEIQRTNPHLIPAQRERVARAVLQGSARHGLDPGLVTAVIAVESSYRPWVTSNKGAVGLMQVMPYMAAPLAFTGNLATIETNVDVGCRILADNIRRLGESQGISAYFWGSQIRNDGYLMKVTAARDKIRRRVL